MSTTDKEIKSQLEEIMPAQELLFDHTPAFGKYKAIMPEEAVQHPAKFNTNLVEYLIRKHTKPGDVTLDPMAGTGVLGVIASLHGRHAIQVELEERFYGWMEKARENVERLALVGMRKGWIKNICGDARCLSELLSQADVAITSPPYSEALSVKAGGGSKKNALGVGIASDGKPQAQGAPTPYSTNEDNIGNLSLGEIDTVITSPPFGDTNLSGGDPEKRRQRLMKAGYNPKDFLGGKARNAVLKHYDEVGSVDCCITSPPYEHQLHDSHEERQNWRGAEIDKTKNLPVGYSENPENIGNLKSSEEEYEGYGGNIGKRKLFIRVPCSPEEAQFHDTRPERKGTIWEWTKEVEATPEVIEKIQKNKSEKKGKSETYLEAMFKVYSEMYKVLKPGGLAIVVIKPSIRKKKVIDLPFHTWVLMSRVGFKLEKLYKLRLKNQSFWRINYYKKYPDVPKLMHEYVLVTRKMM